MNPNSFRKNPWEIRRLKFDFADSLASGDSLASINSITCLLGETEATGMVTNTATTGNYALADIGGGVDGNDYIVRVRVLSTNGDQIEDELNLLIRE